MKEVTKCFKARAKRVAFNVAMLALYLLIFYVINAFCNGIAMQIGITRAFAAFR